MVWRVLIALVSPVLAAAVMSCAKRERVLATQADFIFSGTNLAPHAATIDLADASDYAVVRVDDMLAGREAFRPLVGRTITVRLRQPDRAHVGEKRVYFTNAWHWGEEIGVVEVGSVAAPPAAGMQTMQSDIEQERQAQADRELAERLRSAELVVIGKVAAVRRSDIRYPGTEHDPEWQEADIQIEAVLRGTAQDSQVTILFPATDDPMWFGAPKFAVGMEGIWLLRSFTFGGQRLPYLTALSRSDFQARTEEARIRRLLRR